MFWKGFKKLLLMQMSCVLNVTEHNQQIMVSTITCTVDWCTNPTRPAPPRLLTQHTYLHPQQPDHHAHSPGTHSPNPRARPPGPIHSLTH